MKINVEELIKIIASVSPAVGSSSNIFLEGNHVVFDGERIVGYDGQICISTAYKTDFQFSVSVSLLRNILMNLSQKEIDVCLEDGNLIFNFDKGKIKALSSSGDSILSLVKNLQFDRINEREWVVLPDDFREGLSLCMISVSRDMTDLLLSSIFVDDQYLISSDDLRVSKYKMKKGVGVSFLIPSFAVSDLLKFDIEKFCLESSWIHFLMKDSVTVFSSRVIKQDFHEVDPLFDFGGTRFRLPKDFKSNLNLASIFAMEGVSIELNIQKDKIEYRSTKEDGEVYAWSDVTVNIEEPIGLLINPLFFSKILEQPIVSIKYCENRALFSFGNFQHLVRIYKNEQ